MDRRKIHYMLNSGKNSNLKYYLQSYLREYTPKIFSQWQLKRLLKQVDSHPNREVILQRVAYYCKLTADSVYNRQEWGAKAVRLRDQEVTGQTAYYFDAMQYARYFRQDLRWILDAGDKPYVAPEPAIVKNRPIVEHNDNSVILNLDEEEVGQIGQQTTQQFNLAVGIFVGIGQQVAHHLDQSLTIHNGRESLFRISSSKLSAILTESLLKVAHHVAQQFADILGGER